MPTIDKGIVHLTSTRSVSELLEALLSLLRSRAITVFAVVDHSGEAAKAGMAMPETRLVIFGNPRAGTPMMVAAPDSALDLPMKILLAADPGGSTRVSYNSLAHLQQRYGLAPEIMGNLAAIEQIAAALVA